MSLFMDKMLPEPTPFTTPRRPGGRLARTDTTSIRHLRALLLWLVLPLAAVAQTPLPDSFNPGAEANGTNVNANVFALAVQADGQVLVGGVFATLGGQSRNNIGRVDVKGALDPSFNPGVNGRVSCLAVQADGKILVGGQFTALGGQSRTNIGRLNPDGSVDANFNPGANNLVNSLAVQADGRILVGGVFSTLGGQSRNRIARLKADGTPDLSFNPGAGNIANSLALQTDGRLIVGGQFTTLGGQSHTNIGRLNADGTPDTSFVVGAGGTVNSLALQADGKILVGGTFTTLGGQSRSRIGRLNADGTLDPDFNPGASGLVATMAVQTDGKIVVGGAFTTLGGQSLSRIGRLNADGTLDASFNPMANNSVLSLALQADGKILLGGNFITLGGEMRDSIGRLSNTYPATEGLTFDGSTLTWMRGGTSPEVWRTTFEYSPDGNSWNSLGEGIRIPGGWQLTGLALPTSQPLRARGYAAGGYQSGCAWFVEAIIGSLIITAEPASRTNNAGTTAAFGVHATGDGPFNYQWRKRGDDLADGENILGATTATLTLSNVFGADAGDYLVVVSNASGSVTSLVATLTVIDPVITIQPASQALNAGDSVTLNVVATGTMPLTYQWRKDRGLLTGATLSSLRLTNLQGSDAGSYDVVVSNVWGSVTSTAAVLSVNLALPDSFNPGASGSVNSLAVQAHGKIVVGGGFYVLGGQTRNYIGRINADGTLDTSFNPEANNPVYSLAVQADGKILVGGYFTTLGGQSRNSIGRLDAAGTLDTSFNPGPNNSVYSLAVQADGKILVGGYFITLRGQSRNYIGRLNADGTLDTNFNPGANDAVISLAVQADGKILAGGVFTTLRGQNRNYMGRLNADGTLDTGFNPGANNAVHSLAVQADGKILAGGQFTTLAGQSRNYMGRLNDDGSLEASFNPGANDVVLSLALQVDGKILVGGAFTALGGQSRNRITRLNANGTLDPSFSPGANDTVNSLAVQADGKILVGGQFTTLGGQSRSGIGRLNNTEPATDSLTFDGSTLTWTRGGTSPEVWRTSFDYSPDGGNSWTNLGSGIRIPSGWQLTGLDLPTNTTFRARGYTVGGYENGSSWFVETITGLPTIYSQPISLTNNAGTSAAFSVYANGSGPLSYQWRKDETDLADGANALGATSATLTLNNVLGGDAGGYSVIVTNSFGSVTSVVAMLTVIDPVINVQPAGQALNLGDSITIGVMATGTEPLSYQWRKDGGPLNWATQSSLTLTNVQGSNAGRYDVVVSNTWGSVTSVVASLSVNVVFADDFNPGANNSVLSFALQVDGKILVGGYFTTLGGQSRNFIGRLDADGKLDPSFNPGADGGVYAMAVQADGEILVGGQFTTLGGQSRTNIGRLNADGTLDSSFNPGANSTVNALAVQADGKILLGGSFTTLGGQSLSYIARLNANGTPDTGFNPGADGTVYSVAVQADGEILVGGYFTTLGGQSRTNIGRLNADGTLDSSFSPGADSSVLCLVVQADGEILMGGGFFTLDGQSRPSIGRLHADGTLDTSFNVEIGGYYFYPDVDTLALQADGKILVGGSFNVLGGQTRLGIGRLHADGTLDLSFNLDAGYYSYVQSMAVQADGRILVGGSFGTLGGQSRNYIGRINDSEPAIQSLTFDGSTLTWMRGGTSPEVWRTTFECSLDGSVWTNLREGIRVPGGWQLAGIVSPMNATFRARGYTVGGSYDGSGWFVETVWRPALLISDFFYPAYGSPQFNASGPAGQVVIIESSPNLKTWTPLQTNTLGAGPLAFTDLEAALFRSRFYRLRSHQ